MRNFVKYGLLRKVKAIKNLPRIAAAGNFSLFILQTSFFAACTGGTVFHSYKPLPPEGWERSDTVCFSLPQAETGPGGTLTVGLRTVAHVGMQELVLVVEQCSDSATVCRRDTVHYPLENAEGNALVGGINLHQYETRHLPFSVPKDCTPTIRIHHLMTRESVRGITELGIKVTNP